MNTDRCFLIWARKAFSSAFKAAEPTSSEDISDYIKETLVHEPVQSGYGFIDASQAACESHAGFIRITSFRNIPQECLLIDI